ncbi:7 transmembrane receptor (rhodopsin family) protein [Acanthocheilonema viteae]
MLSTTVILCDILGCLCVTLNFFIISIIIKYRKKILNNIFYVLVFHCSIVDLLRGCCLILWGLPRTLISNNTAIDDRLLILKISQFTTTMLRSCNLLTIFNLLLFTCNEFTVVHYPLFYKHYFERRTILICLFFSWLISFTPGIASMIFSNFLRSSHSTVMSDDDSDNNHNETFYNNNIREYIARHRAINVASMLAIFFFCYLSLFIMLFCYCSIICTIRRFYRKKLMNEDLSPLPPRLKRNIFILKLISKRTDSAQLFSGKHNSSGRSRRHCRNDLMHKHKYVIVIGTILFVYILFLLPYSGIQLIEILHVTNIITTPSHFALIKWSLQILTGMHAACQPLCYFRMVEFRRLANFGGRIK